MSSFLVTGGAGFIGSHLVEALIKQGNRVIVLDNLSSGSMDNLSLCKTNMLEVIRGDIRDSHCLEKLCRGVSGVFHLAALVSVPYSIRHPGLSFDINTRGTQLVLNAARKANVEKVVIVSSAAIYGNSNLAPIPETSTPDPLSPYGLDKLSAEKLAELYSSIYGLNVVALRLFNVYGPRQDPTSAYSGVISKFVDNLICERSATIFGDGEQIRDFVYVLDVVNALIVSMTSSQSGFHVYNVARGLGSSINQIWEHLCDDIEFELGIEHVKARNGDIRESIADVTRIQKELGWFPFVGIEEGLRLTRAWVISEQKKSD